MILNKDVASKISRIMGSNRSRFDELVEEAGLDPKKDFIGANLSNVDFAGSNLADFNFDYADLRRAWWENSRGHPISLKGAMFGSGDAPINAHDREALMFIAKESKNWSERFYAFDIIVQNFGVTYWVYDLLNELLESDKSKYFRLASLAVFAGCYLKNDDIRNYARLMADQANARANMFRAKKLRRMNLEAAKYMQSVDDSLLNYPGQVVGSTAAKSFSKWNLA